MKRGDVQDGNAGMEGRGGSKKRILKAGGAVALAGLCVTGVASGIACPLLMGAAGTLAYSAMRRKEPAPEPAILPVPREGGGGQTRSA